MIINITLIILTIIYWYSILYKPNKESFNSTSSESTESTETTLSESNESTESTPTESTPTESTPTESTPTESTPTESTPTESTESTTPEHIQSEFLCNNFIPHNLGDHIDNVIIPIKPTSITPNNYLKINDAYIRNNTTYVSNNTPINTYKKQPNFIKDLKENKVLVNPYINRDNFIEEITAKQQHLVSLSLDEYFKQNPSLNKEELIQNNSLEQYKKLAFKDNISDYFEENNLFNTLFDSGNGEWETGTNDKGEKVVCDFKPF
jgi:hypothetical protein